MFNREESVAFMTAEKFMETMADKATASAYKSATEKIRTILRHADKNYVENIESSVAVLHNPYLPVRQDDLKYLNTIIASINEQKVVHITYQSVNGYDQSQRDIEPLGVYFASSRWYLIAFCHLKNDYRNFRVDKILSVHLIDKNFAKKHPTLYQYLQAQPKEDRLIEVVLKMKKQDVPKLGEQKYYMGFVAEKEDGDEVIMTFMTASLDGFAKAYFIYGEYVEVLTPEPLKDLIIQIGTKIIHKVSYPT
jgi:predicted DNA-binding transcriptional regulator YafY